MTAEAILEEAYRQILAIKRENHRPTEVRLGSEDYYTVVKAMPNPYTGPMAIGANDEVHLFGVPVRQLPIAHAVDVI
jgi:hypothetical protein